jgi:hypothetical protein
MLLSAASWKSAYLGDLKSALASAKSLGVVSLVELSDCNQSQRA